MSHNKKVYIILLTDILHKGHINIPKIENKYGDVIVGLLTGTQKEKKILQTRYE